VVSPLEPARQEGGGTGCREFGLNESINPATPTKRPEIIIYCYMGVNKNLLGLLKHSCLVTTLWISWRKVGRLTLFRFVV
jgi:hypothetical protein